MSSASSTAQMYSPRYQTTGHPCHNTSLVWLLAFACLLPWGGEAHADDPFRRENLVAWCIVPFDSQKRSPAERAEMLEKLGIRALAYDYRAEHIPTFDDELEQLAKRNIKLTAWWFPTVLNDEARLILEVLKRHKVKTQLWVTGGGTATQNETEQAARIDSEVARIRPIAQAAAAQECTVGLYNHGGWFGEPENQIAIIERLRRDGIANVGIVYNQHHGHAHVARFKELLTKMQPYLMVLNLNGMVPDGDKQGQKIVPLGAGSQDVALLKIIRDSGYSGPIGILNHTDHDAAARLQDNLQGLDWLRPQLDGQPAAAQPIYRTWKGAAQPALNGGQLYAAEPAHSQYPLSVVCRVELSSPEPYNILVAHHTKASGQHWELFTQAGNGRLAVYVPGAEPNLIVADTNICDGRLREVGCILHSHRVQLFIDGRIVADEGIVRHDASSSGDQLAVGRLVEGGLQCFGTIESVKIYAGLVKPEQLASPSNPASLKLISDWTYSASQDASPTSSAALDDGANEVRESSAAPAVYDAAQVEELAAAAAHSGRADRGVAVFASARSACLTCHKIGNHGGSVGPDLTKIGTQRTALQLAESILWPNQQVEDKYKVYQALTDDGQIITGFKSLEDDRVLVLRDPSTGNESRLDKAELEAIRSLPSVMPEGLANSLDRQQQLDLVAFMADLGRHNALPMELAQSVLEHAQPHEPASFPWSREPLDKQARADWQAFVNRDRLYDFYTKEANHFRTQKDFEPLLAEYPGIDGGKQGHWGNQNEASWESDAWNQSVFSGVQAGVFKADKLTVARAVCVRLGEAGEMSVCFDPDTLSYRALWQGGFVKFSKVRHGFIDGMFADGLPVPLPDHARRPAPLDEATQVKYLGYYRVGPRVAFAYRVGSVEYLDTPWYEEGQFTREVAPRTEHSLGKLLIQAASLPVSSTIDSYTTQVQLGSALGGSGYAIDTIEIPWDNPNKTLFYCGDHDFLPDGSALVCTMQGDVWHVSGFSGPAVPTDQWPTQATWRRFASGLHHALGLRVGKDGIFVLCRDQLTRLHDLNNDGQADWYECYSNAFETSPAGHDYICGLQRDVDGNFYTASGNQGLVRISRDGAHAQAIAGGFRNPDGLGIYPDGTLTVPCSEGEWTPASMICAVQPNKWLDRLDRPVDLGQLPFYGYRGAKYVKLPLARPELPLVYLPRGLDNSAGGQVYVDSNRWGPLPDQMIHLSFGTGSYFILLRDEVDGQMQGAIVPMPGQFLSGVHRGRFSPADGQLYVSGMAGWGSYTTDRGCFQRVRYTGAPTQLPLGFHLHENGIAIRFSQPLNRALCEQASEHFAQAWNYRYSTAYGSAEYSTRHYGMRGHDQLRIASAHVVDDGRTLFLHLPDLQRCNQLHVQVATSADQRHELFATCNALDGPRSDIPQADGQRKQLAPHPLDIDMAMAARRLPNPWRKKLNGARALTIEAGKNLSYSTRQLKVKAGETLALTFANPDVVPHNWALIKPGTLERVGGEANKLVADPEAVIRQYVPQSDDVICYTDIVEPQGDSVIFFKAPETPGRYPFLCTFPGHWMVMNGEMVVE